MITHSYDSALVPSREIRYTADSQKIIEITGDPLITLVEAKNVLHVHHDQDDTYIEALLAGTVRQVEGYIRQDVVGKTRQAYWRRNSRIARLPFGPHGDVTQAKLIVHDGDDTTLVEGTNFIVQGLMFKWLSQFDCVGELAVTFESGYEDPPPEVKAAIFQELSLQYKNRQDPDTPAMTSYRNLSLEARHLLAPVMRLAL